MSTETRELQLRLTINGQQSLNTISKLEIETEQLAIRQRDLNKALTDAKKKFGENSEEYRRASRALSENRAQITANNTSLNQLRESEGFMLRTTQSLNREMREQSRVMALATVGSQRYAAAQARAAQIQAELAARRNTPAPTTGGGGLSGSFLAGLAGGGVVALASKALETSIEVVANIVKARAEFSKAMGSLAAITGLDFKKDAKDLEFYADAAHSLSSEFGIASTEIIKTITVVGSLKPELLKQKEALISVTQDIITLSKASGGMLGIEDAAKAVTGALNQFDEGASQSTRYINIMAAGAKAGSSEISETAAAFKESGAILKLANVSFEQSNALVQALSSKMIKGGQAGTNLRNMFSKLLTGADELNPAIVGVEKSLERLSKMSPAEMVKLFGQENIVAATTLVSMRKEVGNLTKAVTGTNEAFDQYAKQTENLSGDIDKFSSAWSETWVKMGENSDGFFRKFIQGGTKALNWFSDIFKNTTITFQGGMLPIGFDYDSKAAAAQKLALENQKKTQALKKQAAKDVADSNSYWEKSAAGKTIDEKKINASKETIRVSREQALKANQEYLDAVKNKVTSANRKELADLREAAFAKLKIAKMESERLVKSADDNAKLLKSIRDGNERKKAEDTKKGGDKKSPQERLAEQRLDNHARLLAEIQKMEIEVITNESDKKEAQLRFNYEQDVAKEKQLVLEKKTSQVDYENWLKARKKSLNDALIENDRVANDKIAKEVTKINQEAAKRVLETQKANYEAELELAKASNDDKAELEAQINLLIVDKELALLVATEEEKYDIIARFALREKALKEKYANDAAKNEVKNLEDLRKAQGEYDDYINGKKKELYQKIGQYVQSITSIVSELFNFERQGIDNQVIAEDNKHNQRIANLENQKNQGIIGEAEYNEKKTLYEKQHDDKSREIKKKSFEADKRARIAQIIMTTAQAVISALATVPPNPFMAVAAGVVGALQLANALNTEAPGYASGDFIGSSQQTYPTSKKPTSTAQLIWANEKGTEFMLNNDAVSSPDFPVMLPLLRKLNQGQPIMPDISASIGQRVKRYQAGDFITDINQKNAVNIKPKAQNLGNSSGDSGLTSAVNRLNDHLDNGIQASVNIGYQEAQKIQELQSEIDKIKSKSNA